MGYAGDEAFGPIEPDRLLVADEHPQQTIEAEEVIDMRVRDEHVLQPLDFACRQIRQVADVKQKRAAFEHLFDIDGWIAGSAIDEESVQKRSHKNSL